MKLIIGGVHQGKLETAKEKYHLNDQDVFNCEKEIDFSFQIINKLELYILDQVKQGELPSKRLKEQLDKFDGKIVILNDISCGVVPTDKQLRLWREETGRVGVMFAQNASEVIRVYCGIATKLK